MPLAKVTTPASFFTFKKKKKNLFLHIVDNTSINLFKLSNQQNGGDRQKAQYVPTWRLPVHLWRNTEFCFIPSLHCFITIRSRLVKMCTQQELLWEKKTLREGFNFLQQKFENLSLHNYFIKSNIKPITLCVLILYTSISWHPNAILEFDYEVKLLLSS